MTPLSITITAVLSAILLTCLYADTLFNNNNASNLRSHSRRGNTTRQSADFHTDFYGIIKRGIDEIRNLQEYRNAECIIEATELTDEQRTRLRAYLKIIAFKKGIATRSRIVIVNA